MLNAVAFHKIRHHIYVSERLDGINRILTILRVLNSGYPDSPVHPFANCFC